MPVSKTMPQKNNAEIVSQLFSYKKAVFIAAHPDDIEFYCGALVHKLIQNKVEVIFVIATRGGRGKTGSAKDKMEALRTAYQLDSAKLLGGAEVIFYDYPDSSLSAHIEELSADIKNLLEEKKPDIVFAWDNDYIYNPHPDHKAAAEASKTACIGYDICHYGTLNPSLWFGFTTLELNIKLRSLLAHKTELPWYYYPLARFILIRKLKSEGAKIDMDYAEVFRN